MISDTAVASEQITIDAPAELVWSVIVDFANYGQWNSFCPGIEGELALGAPLSMQVDLGNGPQTQVEYITHIDAPRTVVWSMANKPGDPIHADRTQRVTPITPESCSYDSIDDFSGEASAAMIEALGVQIESGFQRCAEDLKRRAEQLYSEQQAGQ